MENQRNPSILLVEDEPALALIIKDTLEGEGFQVTHTSDGLHGLDCFARCRPDLVVADIMMPGMDGVVCAASTPPRPSCSLPRARR